jgi:hypothetical protein
VLRSVMQVSERGRLSTCMLPLTIALVAVGSCTSVNGLVAFQVSSSWRK